MRTAEYGSNSHRKFERELEENNGDTRGTVYEICDNNQTYECLKSVDELLKPYDLQIVIINPKQSDIVFKIEEVEKEGGSHDSI